MYFLLYLYVLLFLSTVSIGGQPLPVSVLPHPDQVSGHGQHPVWSHTAGVPQAGGEDHEESVRAESGPPRATLSLTDCDGHTRYPWRERPCPAWPLTLTLYFSITLKDHFFPGDFNVRCSQKKGEAQAYWTLNNFLLCSRSCIVPNSWHSFLNGNVSLRIASCHWKGYSSYGKHTCTQCWSVVQSNKSCLIEW